MLNLNPPVKPVWQTAFRPFFLLGSAFSCVILILWSLQLGGFIQLNTYGNVLVWHGHEMLFGFTMAIVVGFLLTAVRNWTGKPSAQGRALKLLVALWLLSRAGWMTAYTPAWLLAMLDMAFPIYAAYWMAKPLQKTGQKHNWPFVLLLLLLGFVQPIYHLALNYSPQWISSLHQAAVLVMVNLIFWIGGRILPFFVQARLQIPRRNLPSWLTPAAMISSWALIPLVLVQGGLILQIVAGTAAILHSLRLGYYWRNDILQEPMLWSLFLAPLWIIGGFVALALESNSWLHCMTVGGIGGMILSMISRVSLGHSGEPIRALRWIPIAFVVLSFSSVIRVVAVDVQFIPAGGYLLTALFWVVAFGCFLAHYSRRLLSARRDGKPG